MLLLSRPLDQDLVNRSFAVAEAFCFDAHTLQERQQQVIERTLFLPLESFFYGNSKIVRNRFDWDYEAKQTALFKKSLD